MFFHVYFCFQGYWKKKVRLLQSSLPDEISKQITELETDLKENTVTEVGNNRMYYFVQ